MQVFDDYLDNLIILATAIMKCCLIRDAQSIVSVSM